MAEGKDLLGSAPVEAPVVEEKLVKVYLTTQFQTNEVIYGTPEQEDENGELVVTTVEAPEAIADDLNRRQREHDRVQRERFTSRKFRQTPSGATVIDNSRL